jgi:nitrogen fixation NifU-like protein
VGTAGGESASGGEALKQIRNPNDEIRKKSEFQIPKPEKSVGRTEDFISDFGLRASFGFRISAFGFFNMFDDLNDLYQQVILDHCKKPRNFHEMPQATCSAQGHNPLCGDQLKLFLALEGDTIKDISFVGSGCCISKASASLLTEFAKGKSKPDVEKMFMHVHEMVMSGTINGDVGKLAVFAGVHKYPARVKCAILAWHAVMAALKGDAKPVTTESEEI